MVRKVVVAPKAIRHAWDVVGLERSLEVVLFACPGGGGGVHSPREVRLPLPFAQAIPSHIEPTYVSGRLIPPETQAAVGPF